MNRMSSPPDFVEKSKSEVKKSSSPPDELTNPQSKLERRGVHRSLLSTLPKYPQWQVTRVLDTDFGVSGEDPLESCAHGRSEGLEHLFITAYEVVVLQGKGLSLDSETAFAFLDGILLALIQLDYFHLEGVGNSTARWCLDLLKHKGSD
eukprot:CAMPEP_0170487238 /NCGR_PEP_ID=MMETSP0208-20121228/6090_1 /TAXON_ID=197538 /ORGANISM="Strombidium inclinatum, Strain S3" /LENGTH=148 /DNA_ID=CAMNT_0010761459 /DNA_START=6065 /DNA_END=6513 /DNA_ORIENTATION=-